MTYAALEACLLETDAARRSILSGLNTPHKFFSAVDALLAVVPSLLLHSTHRSWKPLVWDALLIAQQLKHTELQVRLLGILAQFYIRENNLRVANAIINQALQRAHEQNSPECLLEAYAQYFAVMAHSLQNTIDQTRVDAALALMRRVERPDLLAILYYRIALCYTITGEYVRALGMAQTAHGYARAADMREMSVITAWLMAKSCRKAERLSHAEHFLGVALHISWTDLPDNLHTALAHERGMIFLKRGLLAVADKWLQSALQYAEKSQIWVMVYRAHAALGYVHTRQGAFTSAAAHFDSAEAGYRALNNTFEVTAVEVERGCLEARRGCPAAALKSLERALHSLDALPATPACDDLRALIYERIALIRRGVFGTVTPHELDAAAKTVDCH